MFPCLGVLSRDVRSGEAPTCVSIQVHSLDRTSNRCEKVRARGTPFDCPMYCDQILALFTAEDVKLAEFFRRLTAQFGEQTLPHVRVFAWHTKFVEGRCHVENEDRDRRPRKNITAATSRVGQLVEGYRRLTTSGTASEVGISYGSTFSILTEVLGFCEECP